MRKEIVEDGWPWQGTKEELEAWKIYKEQRATSFIQRGYSILWARDPSD